MSYVNRRICLSLSSSESEGIRQDINILKIKSETCIISQNIAEPESMRPRSKSLTANFKSSDIIERSKQLVESDSLSLKLSSSFESDEITRWKFSSQGVTQNTEMSDTIILDPDDPENDNDEKISPSTSNTVLLDHNENEENPKLSFDKQPSSQHYKDSKMLISMTTMSQTASEETGLNSKFKDVPSSLDVLGRRERNCQALALVTPSQNQQNPLIEMVKDVKVPLSSYKKCVPHSQDFVPVMTSSLIPDGPNDVERTSKFEPILKTPERVFVEETQEFEDKVTGAELSSVEKSPDEIPSTPEPPSKRRRKGRNVSGKGECPLCGRMMKVKVLEQHADICNGSDRSNLTRSNSFNILALYFL